MSDIRLSDEMLAVLAKNGDKAAMERIMGKYAWLARQSARDFRAPGFEAEDLSQEGMIGLYRAVMGFDAGRAFKFYFFAKLCGDRQIQSAVKGALRGKHEPLKSYAELTEGGESTAPQPIDVLINREDKAAIEELMSRNLSALEYGALSLFIKGYAYGEIAERLGCPRKTVDNALVRARRKVKGKRESGA